MELKKIWERFSCYQEVDAAWEADGAIMSVCWARISWLYMDDIPGESRLDFLRRAYKRGILTGKGCKEMEKLTKAEKRAMIEKDLATPKQENENN